jgi:asparagine synthase (glutamine-hydrolysing)
MCGIIGIASRSENNARAWLIAGRDAMTHRGPDDAGEWWSKDGRVGLGHRRLSIIDLSPAGHQPMQDTTTTYTIVFNGEIYNYHDLKRELEVKGYDFRSHSDTEVILAAYHEWGTDCLTRLNGMFAFALYDSKRQKLFLARDRAGEKPLFYSLIDGEFRFSSELKGLLVESNAERRIDPEALDLYLSMGYVPGDRCIVKGVNKLSAAHAMLFDLESATTQVWRYWTLPEPLGLLTSDSFNELELLNEFDALLENSVQRQMEADVPVGVLLSGGVDSSLITAMAARSSNQVKTFTIGFPEFGKYDESEHARLISEYFGTDHIELNASHIEPSLLKTLAHQYDEPIVDSSMLPTYLVSQLVREHCTVALGGDGGDELFGGYSHYNRLLWTNEKFDRIPQFLRSAISNAASAFLPLGITGRYFLQSLGSDLNNSLPVFSSFFDKAIRQRLMKQPAGDSWQLVAEDIRESRIPAVDSLLQRATRMEFENYMVEDILVKIDRASMLNSLELRAPLLDYRIIEFAFGRVPSSLKTTLNSRKILLKKLAAKLLPQEFDQQRKQGFSIPLADWLKGGPWRDFFQEILLDDSCMFDKIVVAGLFNGQDKGRSNQDRLFSLVMFELWRREYKLSI